jgi:hypothetical protein
MFLKQILYTGLKLSAYNQMNDVKNQLLPAQTVLTLLTANQRRFKTQMETIKAKQNAA